MTRHAFRAEAWRPGARGLHCDIVEPTIRLPTPAIAFDVTPLQNAHLYRGIGTYVRGLARRLALQTEIPIEFWGWAGDGAFQAAPPHRTVLLPRSSAPEYRGAWLFALMAMRRRARLSPVRAVHITDPQALTPLGARKLMTTVYDLIPLKQGLDRRRFFGWAGYQMYLRALKRVDTYFAISEHTAGDLVRLLRIPPNRIVVAPPGVELPAKSLTPRPPVRPYFLFLGGPNPNKNLSVLLEAMAICADLHEELRIAGRWLPKQVSALDFELTARSLSGRVRHLGFVPDEELLDLMIGASALVVPSKDEGFGLPVGEGLAAGAAVVHSRIAVLEEISAGAALTFDPNSAEELATCLRRVAGDLELAGELRRRGIKRAAAVTWDLAFERTMAAYRAAVAP